MHESPTDSPDGKIRLDAVFLPAPQNGFSVAVGLVIWGAILLWFGRWMQMSGFALWAWELVGLLVVLVGAMGGCLEAGKVLAPLLLGLEAEGPEDEAEAPSSPHARERPPHPPSGASARHPKGESHPRRL